VTGAPEAATREYDIVIIGGGPAGLAAGLYAARGMHRTLLLEKGVVGGQISLTELVENYPGVPTINGFDLAQTMLKQSESYGMETDYSAVSALERRDGRWVVKTDGADIVAKAVIVTSGADYNRLGVPGEERLTGKGVSYCATCDAAFFKGQDVAVVGGGDAAMDEGLCAARYAVEFTVIRRRDERRASRILQVRAFANPKMEFMWNTVIDEILGEGQVNAVRLRDVVTGEEREMPIAAVFIFIGQHPNTDFLAGLVKMDAGGHAVVDEWMRTEQPGLFAAGDVRQNSARQVASSVGDGVTAAIAADHYISDNFSHQPSAVSGSRSG